ncbi:Cytochrome b5 reductase 4 [Phytophthora pseudosyringae]|uniref:Cytochrome b5 reductase 4 n=1 Tax=Phytophthora pseudosyringae TaxID=221518 RepID=A0A8T1VX18_9STRA|nr:Cytochrome b5 reductase 4 [Phytophthora pseudosyringae]
MGGCPTMIQRRNKVALPPGYSQLHWMRLCQSGQDLSGLRGGPPRRAVSMEEVNRHNTEDDCWSVLDGKVYNMTPYLKFHPGGIADLLLSAGGDCTDLFNEKHPWVNGHSMLDKCYIGQLDPDSVAAPSESTFALDKTQWRAFTLAFKQTVSQETVRFTFELPGSQLLGLEIPGQHLKVRARINGQMIERAFTPTSKLSQPASFDLTVKVYPDGVMSSHLDKLAVGDSVEMLGPQGVLGYPEAGVVTVGGQPKLTHVRHVVMVAAGTGIAPMLQLIRAILENSKDAAKITLVDCNHSLKHIIALTQLEPLANMFPDRVKVHHVLRDASEDDSRELGSFKAGKRLDKAMLAELLPKTSHDVAAFHCGPPAFDEAVSAMLKDVGFKENQIFMF